MCLFINSRLNVFYKLGVLKNLAQFVGKHTGRSTLLLTMQAGSGQFVTFRKRNLWQRNFPVSFVISFRTAYRRTSLVLYMFFCIY